MRGKKAARLMSRLAVLMMAPVLGATGVAQAGEQVAGQSAPAEQGIPFAQVEMANPMGTYGPAAGPGGPAGSQGAGPGWGYGGPGSRGMMGPGMMQGPGGPSQPMRGDDPYGMRSVIQAMHLPDLSDEQRNKLRTMAQELRKKHWDLKGKMMEESDTLGQLWAADPVDANAVGEAYGRLFDLQRQWIVSAIETRQQVDNLLTAKQKQWLRGAPPMQRRAFPMMPPGMMPGMPGAPAAGAVPPGGEAPGSTAPGSAPKMK